MNLNEVVELTLTDVGLHAIRVKEAENAKLLPDSLAPEPHRGPHWRGTRWECMEIFAPFIRMGAPVPFERNEIQLPVENKQDD